MSAHGEEKIPVPADACRAVCRRSGAHRRAAAAADGADLVSGPQPRHGAPDLAEDARRRRHHPDGDGRRAVSRRASPGRGAPHHEPLRGLPRLHRGEPLSRSPRDPRAAPLPGLAARRRRGAGRGSHRSRVRHVRERRRVHRQRQLDRRVRDHHRSAAVHVPRVSAPAGRAPLEDDRRRRHSDRGLSGERADFLPGDRRLVDRDGPVAGAPAEGRAPATSTSSATSSNRRT